MRIKTIPTYKRGCCALARTPASPTIPMHIPAPNPAHGTFETKTKLDEMCLSYSPARPQASPPPRSTIPDNHMSANSISARISGPTFVEGVSSFGSRDILSAGRRVVRRPLTRTARRKLGGDDDGNNESVNGNHSGENDGDDGAHHKFRLHHSHRRNSDSGLGSSVGSAKHLEK
jgi:hypothetical protein